MDPERQPLLHPGSEPVRYRGLSVRPLTYEEVVHSRQEVTWRRARFCLVIMFWGIIAMFISMIVSILVTAPKCNMFHSQPTVPPVHMTLAPLMNFGRKDEVTSKHYEVHDKILQKSFAPN